MSSLDEEMVRLVREQSENKVLADFHERFGPGFVRANVTDPSTLVLLDDFLPRIPNDAGELTGWVPYVDGSVFVFMPLTAPYPDAREAWQRELRDKHFRLMEKREAAAGSARFLQISVQAGDSYDYPSFALLDDGPWFPVQTAPMGFEWQSLSVSYATTEFARFLIWQASL